MEQYLTPFPIDTYIHFYDTARDFIEHREPARMKRWLNSQPEALPFTEFWDDVKTLVRSGEDESCEEPWRVIQDGPEADDEVLTRGLNEHRIRLANQELRGVWQQLRSFGLLASEDISGPEVADSDAVLDLLERLDYIKPTRLVTLRNSPTEPSRQMVRGIRLVPPVDELPEPGQLALSGIA